MSSDFGPSGARPEAVLLVTRPTQLSWFEWPGEDRFSLFDAGTGLTHLMDSFPAAVLRQLCNGPQAIDTLADRIALEHGTDSDVVWRESVARTVEGLAALQLIEYLPLSH